MHYTTCIYIFPIISKMGVNSYLDMRNVCIAVEVRDMVFHNNISVISWQSVLLVKESREKDHTAASH